MEKTPRKNFFLRLEDGVEGQIETSSGVFKRLYFILGLILISFSIIIIKIFLVSQHSNNDIVSHFKREQVRGNIYDRNGHILAVNLPTKSIYVRPDEIVDINETASALSVVLDEAKTEKLIQKISFGKTFVWIKRHILPHQQTKIKSIGLPGVYLVEDSKRFYPQENEFSHLVGFVDIDQNGISGIEKSFNEELSNGHDIKLSLDLNIQSMLRNKLNQAIVNHDALGGMAVIMNPKNGEIISLVSLPDFNPNKIESSGKEAMFNRATLGLYEMGSTFKILTVAMGLDTGAVKLSDSFDVTQAIKLGKYRIKDYKFHKANLSLSEVLIFSSNRGIGQVGMKLGIQRQQEYLRKLGMLSPVDIEIVEKSRPMHISQKQWNDVYLVTISYGHGIAVSAIHSIQAIAAVTNGGILYKPTIIKQSSQPEGVRVFKETTSQIMRKIMRLVVEQGYAKKAEVAGYNIGGKTGTAEKVKHGKYMTNNCNLALFIGAFPINDPQYVMFLAVDEPKQNKLNAGFTTGGWIAAPLAAEILDSGSLLGVKTTQQRLIKVG